MSQYSLFSKIDPGVTQPITHEVYSTPSSIVPQEDTWNEANFFKHESLCDNDNTLARPPGESWPSAVTSLVAGSIYDNGMGAVYGQPQNDDFLQTEFSIGHSTGYSTGYPMLLPYLDNNLDISTPYSGTLYASSVSTGLERAFISDHTSSLHRVQKESEMQNPSYNHEYNGDTPFQSANLDLTKGGNAETPSRQRSKSSAMDRNYHTTGQSLHFKVLEDEAQAKPQSSDTRRVRQQNRAMAGKLRAKKNKNIQNLQMKEELLRNEYGRLKLEVSALRFDITELKSSLLLHSQCGCSLIQRYINCKASNLVSKR